MKSTLNLYIFNPQPPIFTIIWCSHSNPPLAILPTLPPLSTTFILFNTSLIALPNNLPTPQPEPIRVSESHSELYPYEEYRLPAWLNTWQPPKVAKGALSGIDESTLMKVAKLVEELRNASLQFETVAHELKDRLQVHTTALAGFSKASIQVRDQLATIIIPNHEKLESRISKIKIAQRKIHLRVDTVLQVFLDGFRSGKLSPEEVEFIKQIVALAREVRGTKGRIERVRD